MKKYIEVILSKQKKIQKVKRGYAFNYLIPNGLAELATEGKIKHLNMLNASSSKKKDKESQFNKKISNYILQIGTIHVKKKCGKNEYIFGSISEQDIQDYIFDKIGEKINKKQILLDPIKQIGIYDCHILINETTKTHLKLHILPYNL
jgi:large subunit ribosomal protein L9